MWQALQAARFETQGRLPHSKISWDMIWHFGRGWRRGWGSLRRRGIWWEDILLFARICRGNFCNIFWRWAPGTCWAWPLWKWYRGRGGGLASWGCLMVLFG